MRVSIIAAVAENGVIGREGRLPWHLADDLRRFKRLTMGHTLVMGRKTWDSIGRPLPGRRMVVLSRQADFRPVGAEVADSLDDALAVAQAAGDDETFIIGGAEVYRLALPRAERMYITRVHANIDGDAYFPILCWSDWRLVTANDRAADDKNDYDHTLQVYERVA